MWKEILVLNGTISQSSGEEIDEEKLFQLLTDNGYEYEGGYEKIHLKEMKKTISIIEDFITNDVLIDMLAKLTNFYGEMSREDIEDFFSNNFGTGEFDGLLKSVLSEDLMVLYQKYTHTNWQIADRFGSEIGMMINKKLDDLLKMY